MTKSYKVQGMHCASCAARLEKVIAKLDGVKSCSVNFATETLSVDFDNNVLKEKNIIDAVEKAGFSIKRI